MHHFIYATKDSWISSGSNIETSGISEKDQNFGRDQILEVKKNFYNKSFDHQTRALVYFDLSELSQSLVQGKIKNPQYYLRLYEAEGNSGLSQKYTLSAHPLSQSWDEGTGKFGDNPKVTNGCSWENRNQFPGASAVTWSYHNGAPEPGGAYYTGSGYEASQSFSYESPDVDMNITTLMNNWLGSPTTTTKLENHGLLLKFSGSQETDNTAYGRLKFFSVQSNTIYAPKLEIRWDDHTFESSSKWNQSSTTGSLQKLDLSGDVDNYLYMKGLRESYKENEKVKFRVGARQRYIQKTFSTSVQTVTGSFIGKGSGSYSIVDLATGETMVPFSAYTSMSCDPTSNYFIQWLNGFAPDRMYKIMFKLKHKDGQEIIYDDNFEFKVKR
jgi:hypothetical protein